MKAKHQSAAKHQISGRPLSIYLLLYCMLSGVPVFAAPTTPAKPAAGKAAATPVKKYVQSIGPSKEVCAAYLGRLRSKLVNNWYLPDGNNSVTVTMSVNNDGSTGDIKSTSAPASPPAETAAMDAMAKCQPLEALPTGFPSGAKLSIVFASKADPHGDSSSSINLHIDPIIGAKPEAAAGAAPAQESTPAAGAPATGATDAPAK